MASHISLRVQKFTSEEIQEFQGGAQGGAVHAAMRKMITPVSYCVLVLFEQRIIEGSSVKTRFAVSASCSRYFEVLDINRCSSK